MPEIIPPVTANPVRPGTQVELNAHLASTIGADVEAAMEKVGWRADAVPVVTLPVDPATPTPPQADPVAPLTSDPVPPQTPTAPTAEVNWEELRDGNGLIAGKWKTPEAATQGVHSIIRLAKGALAERDQMVAKVSDLEKQPRPPAPQPAEPSRVEPTIRSAKRDQVLSTLKEKYELEPIDVDALVGVIAEEAGLAAERVVNTKFNEAHAVSKDWADVDAYMAGKYPDAAQHADALSLFMETNPDIAAEVGALVNAGNRKGAMRHAWLAFQAEHGATADVGREQALRAAAQVRTEEVDKARKDAGLVSSQVSGVHTDVATGPSAEEMARAAELYKAGVKEPYLRMAFGSSLTGPLFD